MAIADQLLEQMFSWLEQRERCAEKLRKLAKELELLRQKCNAAECVGSTYAVVGALSLIGAGMATFFTGGAAAPLLGVAGAVFSGTGVTISVASKIIEGFSSSDTMKDAQRIEEKSNEVAEEIQRLFERLRANSSSADPDEVDRHVMTEILRAMARRNGLEGQINTQTFFDNIPMRFTQSFSNSELTIGLAGILSFFTLKTVGNEFKHLLDKGANELIKQVAKTGFKNVLKGGAKVVGGAVGLAFELPEAIDNWKDLIEKNHVTKASQSLRDTADAILDTCRTLREQFDNIRRMFEEMAKSKRELTSQHVVPQQAAHCDMTPMQQTWQKSVLAVGLQPFTSWAQPPTDQAASTHGFQSLITPVYPVPKQLGVPEVLTSRHVIRQPEPQGDPTTMQQTQPNSVLAVRSRPIYAQAQTPPSQAAFTHGLQSLISPVYPVPKQLGVHGLLTSWHVVPQPEPQGDPTPMQHTLPNSVLAVRSRPIYAQAQTPPSQAASTHGLQSLITPVHPVPKQLGVHGLLTSRHVVPQQEPQGDLTPMQKTQPKSVLPVGSRPISVQAQTAPSQAASTHGLQSLITPVHPVPKQLGVHGLLTSRHVVPQQEAVPRMASVWKEDKNVSREKNIQQGCKEKREPLNKHLFMSSNPAQDQSGNQQTSSPTDQRHQNEREGHQTEQTGRGQERESQQNKETGSGQQGGDDQGDKESDDEDEESDQEDEETDSEEESEEDESKKTGRKRRKRNRKKGTRSKQRGDSEEVVRQCQDSCIDQEQRTIQTPPGTIRVGLLNVRSMNNSRSRILELITQNNLDVFLTTETWLREDNADRVLREVSPQNYHYYYQVRVGQRGGGVANQFSQELQGENIPFDSLTTFECVVTVLHHDEWNQPVPVINVYHPPGYNRDQFRTFLDEFETLLAHFNNYNSLIVTGDFNIWVDQERRSFTDEFYHIWPIYNLEQHVREPTHEGGHTLDLVLTRNVEISGLVVRNDGISDHYTVDFKARPVSKDKREETKKEKDQR
ncbi:uncharacterized protein LOC127356568 isoform X8 [Dicentrarchus labrax]|uniref:uncharacterized protein LOC127356568 isoform X8 n=1 Tax=Dicentrarchus labrax TaxID=13489 RepID=UPI0021F685BF|nr:uncharacterized protein LOC127356568 isoform X8 [Dicentrarchus labrax]